MNRKREKGIVALVQNHIKMHGWPTEPVDVGPATCGHPWNNNKTDCRTAHAYAEAIALNAGETFYAFIYHRPCSMHDDSRAVGGLEYGE